MTLATVATALLFASALQADLPYVPDEYSELEQHLDIALENMISAQTYICQDLKRAAGSTGPRRRYDAVDRRFFDAKSAAESHLVRRLNLKVWVNSCRIRNPGSAFNRHLKIANRALDSAERLLLSWKKT